MLTFPMKGENIISECFLKKKWERTLQPRKPRCDAPYTLTPLPGARQHQGLPEQGLWVLPGAGASRLGDIPARLSSTPPAQTVPC